MSNRVLIYYMLCKMEGVDGHFETHRGCPFFFLISYFGLLENKN